MKFTQRKNRCLTRLMLLAALFAQGVLAAHACVADAGSVQTLAMQSDAESMPCHEAERTISNACLMHCTQSDQVNIDHHTMVAAPVDVPVLHVAMPQPQHLALTLAYAPLPLNTGPPLPIRFCSFLI